MPCCHLRSGAVRGREGKGKEWLVKRNVKWHGNLLEMKWHEIIWWNVNEIQVFPKLIWNEICMKSSGLLIQMLWWSHIDPVQNRISVYLVVLWELTIFATSATFAFHKKNTFGIWMYLVCLFGTKRGFKGQLGVPLTVYPWYLLCSLGILGDNLPRNTHVGLIVRDFPWRGPTLVARGTSNYPLEGYLGRCDRSWCKPCNWLFSEPRIQPGTGALCCWNGLKTLRWVVAVA